MRLLVSRRLSLMRRYQGGTSFGPEPTAADLAAFFGLSRTGPGNYNGPCPLCSGDDRFHVHEVDGRAVVGCRGCIDGLAKPERSARYGEVMRLYRGDRQRTTRHAPAPCGRPRPTARGRRPHRPGAQEVDQRRADPHGYVLPAKLAMVDPSHERADRMMRLFSPAAHRRGQLVLPGFGDLDTDGSALPLALFGLGQDNPHRGGAQPRRWPCGCSSRPCLRSG